MGLPKIKYNVQGMDNLLKQLAHLGSKTAAKRVLRAGANAGGTPMARAVRDNAPVGETGLTKQAIKKKVTGKNWNYTAIIGGDFSVTTKKPDGENHTPAYLLHLLEFGHQAPGGETVPGTHFMQRGYDSSVSEAEARFIERAEEQYVREVEKMKKRARGK